MAEDMPQDSSRPQETSQDSGVSSEGKLSNPTGENTAVQSNQKPQVPTTQNNQNNKKYDLGVLFVHGIGKQKPGDTFETMFWPIKNKLEEILTQNLSSGSTRIIKGYYKATRRNCLKTNTSLMGLDVELQDLGNCKNVAFRESYWHEKNINNRNVSSCEIIKGFLVGAVDIVQAALRIFLLKILQPRVSTIAFMLFMGFVYASFGSSYFRDFVSKNEVNWVIINVILCFLGVILICLFCIKLPDIESLVGQVQSSRLGYVSKYVNTVSGDIRLLMNESTDVLIVSHSMGGYLAYKAIARMSRFNGTIYFVGMGSGLGPMSIIEKPKKVKGKHHLGFRWEKIDIWVYLILFLLVWSELVTLWVNLFILLSDKERDGFILYIKNSANVPALVGLIINVATIFLVYFIVLVYMNGKFRIESLKGVVRYEFYYPADLVGNTSRFVYSNDVNSTRIGDIFNLSILGNVYKRLIFAHDMGYYIKNDIVVNSLSSMVALGAKIRGFSAKNINVELCRQSRKYQWLWVSYITFSILGFVLLLWEFSNAESPLSIAGAIYITPLLIALEYISYFVSSSIFKPLVYSYFMLVWKSDWKFGWRLWVIRAAYTLIDFVLISLVAPSLLIRVIGQEGFLSAVILFVIFSIFVAFGIEYCSKLYKIQKSSL